MSFSLNVFLKKGNKFEHILLDDVFSLRVCEVMDDPFVFRVDSDYYVQRFLYRDDLLVNRNKLSLERLIDDWLSVLDNFVTSNKYHLTFYEVFNLKKVKTILTECLNVTVFEERPNIVFGVRERKARSRKR